MLILQKTFREQDKEVFINDEKNILYCPVCKKKVKIKNMEYSIQCSNCKTYFIDNVFTQKENKLIYYGIFMKDYKVSLVLRYIRFTDYNDIPHIETYHVRIIYNIVSGNTYYIPEQNKKFKYTDKISHIVNVNYKNTDIEKTLFMNNYIDDLLLICNCISELIYKYKKQLYPNFNILKFNDFLSYNVNNNESSYNQDEDFPYKFRIDKYITLLHVYNRYPCLKYNIYSKLTRSIIFVNNKKYFNLCQSTENYIYTLIKKWFPRSSYNDIDKAINIINNNSKGFDCGFVYSLLQYKRYLFLNELLFIYNSNDFFDFIFNYYDIFKFIFKHINVINKFSFICYMFNKKPFMFKYNSYIYHLLKNEEFIHFIKYIIQNKDLDFSKYYNILYFFNLSVIYVDNLQHNSMSKSYINDKYKYYNKKNKISIRSISSFEKFLFFINKYKILYYPGWNKDKIIFTYKCKFFNTYQHRYDYVLLIVYKNYNKKIKISYLVNRDNFIVTEQIEKIGMIVLNHIQKMIKRGDYKK